MSIIPDNGADEVSHDLVSRGRPPVPLYSKYVILKNILNFLITTLITKPQYYRVRGMQRFYVETFITKIIRNSLWYFLAASKSWLRLINYIPTWKLKKKIVELSTKTKLGNMWKNYTLHDIYHLLVVYILYTIKQIWL